LAAEEARRGGAVFDGQAQWICLTRREVEGCWMGGGSGAGWNLWYGGRGSNRHMFVLNADARGRHVALDQGDDPRDSGRRTLSEELDIGVRVVVRHARI